METVQLQLTLTYQTIGGYPCCFTHAVERIIKHGNRIMQRLLIDKSDGFSGGGKALPDKYREFACYFCEQEAKAAEKTKGNE